MLQLALIKTGECKGLLIEDHFHALALGFRTLLYRAVHRDIVLLCVPLTFGFDG